VLGGSLQHSSGTYNFSWRLNDGFHIGVESVTWCSFYSPTCVDGSVVVGLELSFFFSSLFFSIVLGIHESLSKLKGVLLFYFCIKFDSYYFCCYFFCFWIIFMFYLFFSFNFVPLIWFHLIFIYQIWSLFY